MGHLPPPRGHWLGIVELIDHLDLAITEFRDIKMNTYLNRALRHKEILKA